MKRPTPIAEKRYLMPSPPAPVKKKVKRRMATGGNTEMLNQWTYADPKANSSNPQYQDVGDGWYKMDNQWGLFQKPGQAMTPSQQPVYNYPASAYPSVGGQEAQTGYQQPTRALNMDISQYS